VKNYILIFLISIFSFSCRKPGVERYITQERVIVNNSSHSIKIKNLVNYDIILQKNEIFDGNFNYAGKPNPTHKYFILETDSLEIIYDDTLTVFHGSKLYTMFRDLRRNDMFDLDESETNGSTHYTYTYTFTNADFDEAKTK
jgi:hypothetical protein